MLSRIATTTTARLGPCHVPLAFIAALFFIPLVAVGSRAATPAMSEDGIVKVESAYGFEETISRLKSDIASKGIKFFMAVDQSALGDAAGIELRPSTLLVFGNPPLGIQFLTSNPDAGLDWPVRLLVRQDENGKVWAVYTDFDWIARRHGIANRGPQFEMASELIASITSSVKAK